jgi:pSer/pThr/pTyr-binding forkhead associated (FHA) protein
MTTSNQPIARLLWQIENGQQELMLRQEDVVTIGRGEGNIIVFSSARISRNHARIEWNGDGFVVRDMSSSNGTFVNGQRVEYMPLALRDGDLIMLERIPMRFEEIRPNRAEQDINSLPTVPKGQTVKGILKPRLVVTDGPEIGREIIIDDDELTIGRDSQTATWKIRLIDNTVSRPHAKIENRKGIYSLIDLGSANGTTINDFLVIVPVTLNDGDIIGLGASKLTFKIQ